MAEEANVLEFLRHLLASAPVRRVQLAMRQAMEPLPPLISALLEALGPLSNPGQSVAVKTVAATLPHGIRTVERACKAHGLPTPKRLLDWHACLLVLQVMSDEDLHWSDMPHRLAADATHLDTLRTALLPATPAEWDAHASITFAIAAFVQEVRAARSAAREQQDTGAA